MLTIIYTLPHKTQSQYKSLHLLFPPPLRPRKPSQVPDVDVCQLFCDTLRKLHAVRLELMNGLGNMAVREALPHLVDVAASNPHGRMLVRSVAFSSGARWHISAPTPVEQLAWTDLTAGGYTDLGAALDLLREALQHLGRG